MVTGTTRPALSRPVMLEGGIEVTNRSNGTSSHGTDSLVGGHHLTYPSIAYDYNTTNCLGNPLFKLILFMGVCLGLWLTSWLVAATSTLTWGGAGVFLLLVVIGLAVGSWLLTAALGRLARGRVLVIVSRHR